MSTAWKCHYNRNTPGYPNPGEQCLTEIQDLLVCPSPVYNSTLTVTISGYSSGIPVGDRTKNGPFYAGSYGIYEVLVTTGVEPNVFPISGATLQLQFIAYSTNATAGRDAGQVTLLNQTITLTSGYTSGYFPISVLGANELSGIGLSYSGKYTGIDYISQSISDYPAPDVDFSSDASLGKAYFTLYNNSTSYYTVDWELYRQNDDNFYEVIDNGFLAPGDNVSFEDNIGATDFNYYYVSTKPRGFIQSIGSDEFLAGHPPAPVDARIAWLYIGLNPAPYLRIEIPTEMEERYDEANGMYTQYSGVGDPGYTDLSAFAFLSEDGYFYQPLSDLLGVNTGFSFKIKGQFADYLGGFFLSPLFTSQLLNLEGVALTANQSELACGVDLVWTAPVPADSFRVVYADNLAFSSPTTIIPTATFAYFHDTEATCGTVYYYKVYNVDTPTIVSNVASGSGRLILRAPFLDVYPIYPDPENTVPLSNFRVKLEWNNANFDTRAQFISGQRIVYNDITNPALTSEILFTYQNPDNSKEQKDDKVNIPLYPGVRTAVEYRVQLTKQLGNAVQATGPERSFFITLPPIPQQPDITGVEISGPNITILWTGSAWEDPLESYHLYRRDSNGNEKLFHVVNAQAFVDAPGAGTWTYFVQGVGFNPEYVGKKEYLLYPNQQFIQLSLRSDGEEVTI